MAMNKKEHAEMESLREQLRIAKAFRFTGPVLPDVPVPVDGYSHADAVNGYGFNDHTATVYETCSTCISHSRWGHSDKTTSWAQQGISQYSTRLLALRGLRNAIEKKVARQLADIDEQISREEAQNDHE